MTVTDQFKEDSARAAIRALRGLEQTAVMLETYAPEIFPQVDEHRRKDFGRVMMESAAKAIRDAWSDAIRDAENAERAREIAPNERETCALIAEAVARDNGMPDLGIKIARGIRRGHQ